MKDEKPRAFVLYFAFFFENLVVLVAHPRMSHTLFSFFCILIVVPEIGRWVWGHMVAVRWTVKK